MMARSRFRCRRWNSRLSVRRGPIFRRSDLAAAELSPELCIAVELVTGICRESGFEPTFVARPNLYPRRKLGMARKRAQRRQGPPGAQRRNHHPVDPGAAQSRVSVRARPRRRWRRRCKTRAPRAGTLRLAASQVNTALQFGKRRRNAGRRLRSPASTRWSRGAAVYAHGDQRRIGRRRFGRTMRRGRASSARAALLGHRVCRAHRNEPHRPRLSPRRSPRNSTSSTSTPPRTDPAVAPQRRRILRCRGSHSRLVPRWCPRAARCRWRPPTARCWRPADVFTDRLAGIADASDFVAHESLRFLASFAANITAPFAASRCTRGRAASTPELCRDRRSDDRSAVEIALARPRRRTFFAREEARSPATAQPQTASDARYRPAAGYRLDRHSGIHPEARQGVAEQRRTGGDVRLQSHSRAGRARSTSDPFRRRRILAAEFERETWRTPRPSIPPRPCFIAATRGGAADCSRARPRPFTT